MQHFYKGYATLMIVSKQLAAEWAEFTREFLKTVPEEEQAEVLAFLLADEGE